MVLLDLGLPDTDGVQVCRQLRQRSDVEIIVVTAFGEESDRVTALDAGADDYLVKPFAVEELSARLRAMTRRAEGGARPAPILRSGPIALDEHKRLFDLYE